MRDNLQGMRLGDSLEVANIRGKFGNFPVATLLVLGPRETAFQLRSILARDRQQLQQLTVENARMTDYQEYILQPGETFDTEWEGYNPGVYTGTSVKCRVRRNGIGPGDLKPLSKEKFERLRSECRRRKNCHELMERYGLKTGKITYRLILVSFNVKRTGILVSICCTKVQYLPNI